METMTFRRKIAATLACATVIAMAYGQADRIVVTQEGTVGDVEEDSFLLENGDRTTLVEMGEIDWFLEKPESIEEKRVTVKGVVDSDFFEDRVIEASQVEIRESGETVTTDAVNPVENPLANIPQPKLSVSTVEIRGTIVDVADESIKVESNDQVFTVVLSGLPEDPFDRLGTFRVAEGLPVAVTGPFQPGFFEEGKITAVTLAPVGEQAPSS